MEHAKFKVNVFTVIFLLSNLIVIGTALADPEKIVNPSNGHVYQRSSTVTSSKTGDIFTPDSRIYADIKTGLIAYYPFNGNANDESGNGNNGAVNGAT